MFKCRPFLTEILKILISTFSFEGGLLQLTTESAYGFTAGAIALLVINAFLMLIGKVNNIIV